MTTVNDPKGEAGSKKAPMWLLPPVALEQTAWVAKLGAEKYGPYNWRETGVCATTYVSAIMRHLNAWRDGEDLDPESGISHIAHIATSCNILMDAAACGTLQDDRNKRPTDSFLGRFVVELEEELSKVSDEELVESFREMGCDVEIVPLAGQIEIDGRLVEYPPVPEGYDRWEYRGLAWKPGRPGVFACRVPSATRPEWVVSCGPEQPYGCANFEYIEAVKDAKPSTTAAGDARQPAIVTGTPVSVNLMYEPAFRSVVEKVVETRDGLLYTFANGLTYSDNEIFSITPISSTPASDTDEQP